MKNITFFSINKNDHSIIEKLTSLINGLGLFFKVTIKHTDHQCEQDIDVPIMKLQLELVAQVLQVDCCKRLGEEIKGLRR